MIDNLKKWLLNTFSFLDKSTRDSTKESHTKEWHKNLAIETVSMKKQIDNELSKPESVSYSKLVLQKKRKLSFNLLPKTQAHRNVRTFLEFKDGNYKAWQGIRDIAEEESKGVCSCCGQSSKIYDPSRSTNTEAHEEWFFKKDRTGRDVQRLIGIYALCFICHNIKHINQHESKTDYFELLINRYAELNGIEESEAYKDYSEAKDELESFESIKFQLDLAYIEKDKNNRYFDCHSFEFNNFLAGYLATKKNLKSDNE